MLPSLPADWQARRRRPDPALPLTPHPHPHYFYLMACSAAVASPATTVTCYVEIISSWCHRAEPAWDELKQSYAGRDDAVRKRIATSTVDFPARGLTPCSVFVLPSRDDDALHASQTAHHRPYFAR